MKHFAFVFLALAPSVLADVTLPVVTQYERAADPAVWKGSSREDIPQALQTQVKMPNPTRAFQAPYNEVFFQNERMVVCADSCKGKKLAVPVAVGADYELRLADPKKETGKIRQATVYFWVNRMFDYLEGLGFRPSKRLVVYVDRDVEDPKNGIGTFNNAFFNSEDWTLSFLRENTSLLYKAAFPGGNPAPSGGDPSVAIHEASHSVFEALIGSALNPQTFGLHEAFADYLALVLLDTRVVGRVMTRGNAIRDESQIKPGSSKAEAHDLGESVAAALIEIRSRAADPAAFDRSVLATMRRLSEDPYAQASDILRESLKQITAFDVRSKALGTAQDMASQAEEIWNRTNLLKAPVAIPVELLPAKPAFGGIRQSFELIVEAPDKLTEDFGIAPYERTTVRLIGAPIAAGQIEETEVEWNLVTVGRTRDRATVPPPSETFWVLSSKDASTVVHAAYRIDGSKIAPAGSEFFTLVSAFAGARRDLAVTQGEAQRYNPQGLMKLIFNTGKTRTSQGPQLQLDSGEAVTTEAKSRDIHRSFLAKGLGQIFGSVLTQALTLRDVGNVTIYTRKGDNNVLGYTIRYMTGLKATVIQNGRVAAGAQ
jgi:hypothetical protein